MAFVKAHIEIKPAAIGTGLKIGMKQIRGGTAKMAVTLTGDAMRATDWRDGDKIEVLIGEGDDRGLMRLRKNASTGQAVVSARGAVRGGKYLVIKLGHQPAFPDRTESARWCQWEKVEDGWYQVVMPAWAQGAVTRAAPPKAGGQPVTRAPTGSPTRQSVTAAVMGDPEPGRRQMLDAFDKIAVRK